MKLILIVIMGVGLAYLISIGVILGLVAKVFNDSSTTNRSRRGNTTT